MASDRISSSRLIGALLILEGVVGAYWVISGGVADDTGSVSYEIAVFFLVASLVGFAMLISRRWVVLAVIFFVGFTGLLGWTAYEVSQNPDSLGFYLILVLPLSFLVAVNCIATFRFVIGLFARKPNPGA